MQSEKTKLFIIKARAKHGERYDYSLVDYLRAKWKVKIICRQHGIFEQTPDKHANRGHGCAECSGLKPHTNRTFIEKARKKHGDKYEYTLVNYKQVNSKVKIKCDHHGVFMQTPKEHMRGRGCPSCAGRPSVNSNSFIKSATKLHGDKYNYTRVNYKNAHTKVEIICPAHGVFTQKPCNHLNGNNCPTCAGKVSTCTKTFIAAAKGVHGGKYCYSLSKYTMSSSKIKILCKEHGVFEQTPNAHLAGSGCSKCAEDFDRGQPAYVYVMKSTNKSKIGISINPAARHKVLMQSQPFTSEIASTVKVSSFIEAAEIEAEVHRRAGSLNAGLKGFDGATEWFLISAREASDLINCVMSERSSK